MTKFDGKEFDAGKLKIEDTTLRDHFAGCALTGLAAAGTGTVQEDVDTAWKMADLMIEERGE